MTPHDKTAAFQKSSLGIFSKDELQKILDLQYGGDVRDLLSTVFLKPLGDLMARPGKQIRGRLVELGYQLAHGNETGGRFQQDFRQLVDALECLHAGSLAVDDVQDGSHMRRGEPALHIKYGLPTAINVGNWLYFWPLELINQISLSPEQELKIYRLYHRTLLRAHFGQALDVGVPVDTLAQNRVHDTCLSTIELKSGAIFSLALMMGAIAGEASDSLLEVINKFGHGLGVGLQMFDDLGNVKGSLEPIKRWEDLVLRRPTWIWACAAKYYSEDIYKAFVLAVHQLPHDVHPLETWFDQHGFMKKAKALAFDHLKRCFADFENGISPFNIPSAISSKLRDLGMEIVRSYD